MTEKKALKKRHYNILLTIFAEKRALKKKAPYIPIKLNENT